MKDIHGGDIYRNSVRLDFSVNINPLERPEELKDALYLAVKKCHEYPDIYAARLKQAVSNALQIPKDNLLFGNGASELFMGILHALRPKKILIPVPSFYGYEYAARAVEGEIVYYYLKEENDFFFQEDFFDFLTEDIDVLFLANPNNPTGKKLDEAFLFQVFEVCREKRIRIVFDECFIEFCGEHASVLSKIAKEKEYGNVLLVRAFTKAYAIPGVRLGYLVNTNRCLLEKIRHQLPEWNLSTFAQEAGIACIRQDSYLKRTAECIREERSFLSDGLKKTGLHVFESEANFLLVKTDVPLYERLLKKGILIRDCENFRGLSKGYYRIAVKQRQENEILLKAIGECIEEYYIRQNRTSAAGGN